MGPTITIDEANERVNKYLEAARAVLPQDAQYGPHHQEKAGTCAGIDSGMVLATNSYEITGLPQEKFSQYFAELRQWWQNNGYTILKQEPDYLWAQHDGDEFRLALKSNDLGKMYLIATSPCVWPNGTPEPSS